MARQRNFSRESVLEKALPVFWKHGFADASLHDLEQATGVNKSGLYSEFEDKQDIYLQSLRHYLARQDERAFLTPEPLGWQNIEHFLMEATCDLDGQKGCFSINSMRDFAILPPAAIEIVSGSRAQLKRLLAKNVAAERPTGDSAQIADLILTFFTGLSMERNVPTTRAAFTRKVQNFMAFLRKL